MGTNKNKNKSDTSNTDINKASGNDPRGRAQNMNLEARQSYRSQQEPLQRQMAGDYRRGTDMGMADYGDIMNRYRDVAGGGGGAKGERISYNDPFKSYGGYEDFSKTGGYSEQDLANIRARGVSPIRAVYSDANRAVERQKALQGGYSPNYTAAKAKMAREQAFSTADAVQNNEAGISEAVQRGKLSGLSGMSGIEGQRLNADLDVSRFNAMQGNQDRLNQLNALQGMTSLYGTTPGMASTFGQNAINITGQGGNMGRGYTQDEIAAQGLPGRYEKTQDYIDTASKYAYPWIDKIEGLFSKKQPTTPYKQGTIPTPVQSSSRTRNPEPIKGRIKF